MRDEVKTIYDFIKKDGFNPNQPRDKDGKWGSGSGDVYTSRAEIFGAYMGGKMSITELDSYGIDIATEKEINDAINNKFMLSVLSMEHNITESELVNRLTEILKYLKNK